MTNQLVVAALSAFFIFAGKASGAAEQAEEVKKPVCVDLVESFCQELWSPRYLGNLDLRSVKAVHQIRLGQTPNEL